MGQTDVTEPRRPVVLDVDTGVDDALALLLAFRSPLVDVLAITCVHGNGDVPTVVANTMRVLDAANAPPDIPVAGGFEEPLIQPSKHCPEIHGADYLGDLDPPLPASSRKPWPGHAVQLLLKALQEASAPVTVVALAPLTNIAVAIKTDGSLWREKCARIVWMGGAVSGGGNATTWGEANASYDPEAAHIVLNSGLPILMYPWDAFLKVQFAPEELLAFGAADVDASGSAVERQAKVKAAETAQAPWSLLASRLLYREMRHFKINGACIGDAGAMAAALLPPEALTTRRLHVDVELQGKRTRGMTVCDLRTFVDPPDEPQLPANADVVMDLDVAAVKDLFSRCVLRGLPN
eukprot:TRINITY_DN49313_c0_g1_i1.p1 TRINITY_DN49313_c0_g1~~TRINITY_DN49313_c0_g1_i1.p1  ORF type:complete len:369 (-),score=69.19 TRINITY_DN49313_c0_g1_i1:420-1469(-)